jgi:hypothetical protein
MPPAPVTPADQLRQRAAALRHVATRIDALTVLDLHRRADSSTWIGPTPQRCHELLLAMRTSVANAADDVRATSRLLDQRAAALDAQAAALGPR